MSRSRRPTRILAAAAVVVATLFASSLQAPAFSQIPSDYEDTVRLFASGDETQALARLAAWSEAQVRAHVNTLRIAAATARRCSGCPGPLTLSPSQIRAALLLHARREIQEDLHPPRGEQVTRCETGLQARAVEHLAAILMLTDPQAGDFLRLVHLAMARQALWSHCLPESRSWAQAGLKLFPQDGALIMSVGVVSETEAFFTPAPAPRTPGLLPSVIRQRETEALRLRSVLDTARGDYEAALRAAPSLFEARLRLGRVLWRLGQPEPARVHFEAVIASAANAGVRYLAHLFLGRIHEERSQWTEAEQQYRAALDLQPGSERAMLALAHARFLQGDVESAREILGRSIDAAPAQAGVDPWISYLIIQSPEGEHILAGLARSLRP